MLQAYKLRIPGNESNYNIPFNAFMHESCKITGRFILNPIGPQIDIATHRASFSLCTAAPPFKKKSDYFLRGGAAVHRLASLNMTVPKCGK